MSSTTTVRLSRIGLAFVIILSGLLLLPLAGLSAENLNWQAFAGAYHADLDFVSEEDKALPGSAFHFVATGYPANTIGSVQVNGQTRGAVMTDANGRAEFIIQTSTSDPDDNDLRYEAAFFTDINHYEYANDFRLRSGEPMQSAPAGWSGATFTLSGPVAKMTVDHAVGAPGSAFIFTATGLPANRSAEIAIDGSVRKTITTDASGTATFAVQSPPANNGRAAVSYSGVYYTTINVNNTVFAMQTCEVEATATLYSLPSNYSSEVIPLTTPELSHSVFIPILSR